MRDIWPRKEAASTHLSEGSNLSYEEQEVYETRKEIAEYQRVAKRIYRVDAYLVHKVAVSTTVLAALVLYEYLRYRGIPLPNAKSITGKIMPTKNLSESMIFRQGDDNKRHEEMGKALDQSKIRH